MILSIVDGCEQLDLEEKEIRALENAGIIYLCEEVECEGNYHIEIGFSWEYVDAFLMGARK